ncbi:uncharacterized protein LOC142345830 [Convolutriloba macropyga]|uniref:uncharacterized protein LOC142345830 n=1 Tax=Convolutriloba macropyga TaxID=536237 RepID=UPI003F522E8E
MAGYFSDLPLKRVPPPSAFAKAVNESSKQKYVQQGDIRLPKGSSFQAQSNRERIVMAKLDKDLQLIDNQKRIVINSVEQEMHLLRMQLREIEDGKVKVSPYLTDVDAARRSVSSSTGGPTPRLLMEPIVSISKSELAKQRAKLLQREYKKQNEMNEYLNQLFKTISDRNIKELSNLTTGHSRNTNTKSKTSNTQDGDDVVSSADEEPVGNQLSSKPTSAVHDGRKASTHLEVPSGNDTRERRRSTEKAPIPARVELPAIDVTGRGHSGVRRGISREKSKVSFKIDTYEDTNVDSALEQEVSQMANNLLDMQKRHGRIKKKLADQNLVWTDGSLALSLRKLRREKNQAEEYVIKNSSSSRAILAATKDTGNIDRSKTVVVQKGKLKLLFVADDRAKKNRDHRKFQSGRNQKIETKIMSFVQH